MTVSLVLVTVQVVNNDPTKNWWCVQNEQGRKGFVPVTHLVTQGNQPASTTVQPRRRRSSRRSSAGGHSLAPSYDAALLDRSLPGDHPWPVPQRRGSRSLFHGGPLPPAPTFVSQRRESLNTERMRQIHQENMMSMQIVQQQQQLALMQQQLEMQQQQQAATMGAAAQAGGTGAAAAGGAPGLRGVSGDPSASGPSAVGTQPPAPPAPPAP